MYKAQELQLVSNVGVVTEGTILLIITQVSSGSKKLHMPRFCKYMYLHVKRASHSVGPIVGVIQLLCLMHSISSQPKHLNLHLGCNFYATKAAGNKAIHRNDDSTDFILYVVPVSAVTWLDISAILGTMHNATHIVITTQE